MTTRIGLLRMCELGTAMSAVHGPYRRVFEMMFADHDVSFLDIAVHEGDTPASLADADVWIASGSPVSVYDDLGWIDTAESIVRDAVATETPLVGICFGHQLVAQALGGRVEQSDRGWGIGAHEYTTVSRPAPLAAVPDRITIIASHQDQVVRAPDGADVWSTSTFCPNAGLAIGERTWTMQAHPEFTPALMRALYPERRDRLGAAAVDEAIATLDRPLSNATIADAVVATAGLSATRVRPLG